MIQMLSTHFESLRRDESGQGLVEYALIIALVSIFLIAVLGLLGDGIDSVFRDIIAELEGAID